MQWDEALNLRLEQLIGALKVDSKDGASHSGGLSILYADDNPINQRVASEMLRKAGHRVDVAGSGALAVSALDNGRYDVVLMDVQMPDIDGCTATAAIRARERESGRPHVPILGLTAYSTAADEARCLEAGMDAYVAKPISEQSLLSALRQISRTEEPPAADEWTVDDPPDEGNILSADIAALLVTEYSNHLANIRRALGEGDLRHVERLAHRLKGAVGLFHAADAFDAADQLEQIASTGDIAQATVIWNALGGELERLIAELGAGGAGRTDPRA